MSLLGKVAIVGAGAVGSYYGARLAVAGEDVTFLLRGDYEHVSEHGMRVESVHGDMDLPQVQCAQCSQDIGVVDLIVIAWKTTSNHLYQSVVGPLVGENTKILTLQNGLGNAEQLASLFGANRVYAGLCFVCINRIQPGLIRHTASGLTCIGAFAEDDGYLDQLGKAFRDAEIKVKTESSLEKALWMKLVWNVPFNGLAIAEGGVDTQVLLEERKLEMTVRAIMQEVVRVAENLGHEIPGDFVDQQVALTYEMGAYRPSSMIDFVEGRDVELDAIWEIPVERAQQLGVAVPEMEKLRDRIRERLALR